MDFLLGGCAATCAGIFSNPFDVIKTRQQLQGELGDQPGTHRNPYRSIFKSFQSILKAEGIAGLQKGLVSALAFQFTMNSIRLGIYQTAENYEWTRGRNKLTSLLYSIGWGGLSGVIGATVACPLYMIKTQIQATSHGKYAVGFQHNHAGTFDALAGIYRTYGITGLWRGYPGIVTRTAVGSSAQLATFSQCKEFFVQFEFFQESVMATAFVASMFSGFFCCVFMSPFDVIATRLFNQAETAAVPVVPVRTYEDAKFPEIARQLVTLRNTRRRQWYRTRDPILGAIVDSLNNRIRFECSIARNQHFSNNIRNLENGAKDVWKISRALRNQVKYSPPLQAGDTLKASPDEKANLLAENFVRAHRNPAPGDPATTSAVEVSVQQIVNSTFPLESVPVIRPKEIARIIKSLKPKKAPGMDKIRNTLLKRLPRKGLVMLTLIVNACFRISYFPSSWKHAIVTAIPKPGKDITNPTNYRPISLLPVMSKILERVVLSRIGNFVEQRNVVPPQQFGFKRGHSTNHQLVRLTRNVRNSLARGESAGMVLLDVEKAYDSVWQDAILHKMKLAGFPAYILKLLNSFLKQRSFQVAVDGVDSRGRGLLYTSVWDCFSKTFRAEGLHGLYKGFVPNYWRIAPHTILNLTFWDQFKSWKDLYY
ncbi:hypothetical protein quinque_014084 [Culex quinquefasciatus]